MDVSDSTNDLKQFLLCTSCTISYILGEVPAGSTPTTEMMAFTGTEANVPVNFVNMDLSITTSHNDEMNGGEVVY